MLKTSKKKTAHGVTKMNLNWVLKKMVKLNLSLFYFCLFLTLHFHYSYILFHKTLFKSILI